MCTGHTPTTSTPTPAKVTQPLPSVIQTTFKKGTKSRPGTITVRDVSGKTRKTHVMEIRGKELSLHTEHDAAVRAYVRKLGVLHNHRWNRSVVKDGFVFTRYREFADMTTHI